MRGGAGRVARLVDQGLEILFLTRMKEDIFSVALGCILSTALSVYQKEFGTKSLFCLECRETMYQRSVSQHKPKMCWVVVRRELQQPPGQ